MMRNKSVKLYLLYLPFYIYITNNHLLTSLMGLVQIKSVSPVRHQGGFKLDCLTIDTSENIETLYASNLQ